MTAPAMDERHEVASRLRALIGGRINWAGLQCAVFGGTALRSDTVARLADLMDPGGAAAVDADGLLALADALGGARNCCDYFGRSGSPCGDCPARGRGDCQAAVLRDAAKRIRECVGDASVRPRDAVGAPKTCDRQSECDDGPADAHRAVYAADGEPLEVGQAVWHVRDGIEFTVAGLPNPGEYQSVKLRLGDEAFTGLDPDQLTHTKPEPKRICGDCRYWRGDPSASHMGVCFNSYRERCCVDSYAAQLDYAKACDDFEGRGE